MHSQPINWRKWNRFDRSRLCPGGNAVAKRIGDVVDLSPKDKPVEPVVVHPLGSAGNRAGDGSGGRGGSAPVCRGEHSGGEISG